MGVIDRGNKKGQDENHPALLKNNLLPEDVLNISFNWYRLPIIFDVYADDASDVYNDRLWQSRCRSRRKSLINRLFQSSFLASLFIDNYNTAYKEHKSDNNEDNASKPWHAPKEIAGHTNRGNGFAHVAQVFGNKFFSGFVQNRVHDKLLSLNPSAERQLREAAVNGTDIHGFKNNALGGSTPKFLTQLIGSVYQFFSGDLRVRMAMRMDKEIRGHVMDSPSEFGTCPLIFNFNAGDWTVYGGPKEIERTSQSQKGRQLLSLPLFLSFFRDHSDANAQRNYSEYNKSDTKWQGQVLEKVAGKPNADYVFTQVTNNFSNKLPGFFVKEVAHGNFLSFGSVGERQLREAAANGTDIHGFKHNALGGSTTEEKGQDENHPALSSCSLMDEYPS